jgi:hypothetical protein
MAASCVHVRAIDGFDETPPENINALIQLFGALKRRWPKLRTVATLDWSEFDVHVKLHLPVDVWVQEPNAMRRDPQNATYWNQSGWNSSSALSRADIAAWTGAGRQYWQYHCCCYALDSCLNSFVEWPAQMNRLMPWLASACPSHHVHACSHSHVLGDYVFQSCSYARVCVRLLYVSARMCRPSATAPQAGYTSPSTSG